MLGLILANIIGVLFLGAMIAEVMTPQTIELVSGTVFVLIGIYLIIGGKGTVLGWFGVQVKED